MEEYTIEGDCSAVGGCRERLEVAVSGLAVPQVGATSNELVVYCPSSVHSSDKEEGEMEPPQLCWNSDWAGTIRLYRLLVHCVRLKVMLAWSSTIGGAHSALGDTFTLHAEKAGVISHYQLALADRMGDDLLASRCKLYAAYSLLQRNKLHQAARIVRDEYHFISKESTLKDPQLKAMCLSIWKKLQFLYTKKHLKQLPPTSDNTITTCPAASCPPYPIALRYVSSPTSTLQCPPPSSPPPSSSPPSSHPSPSPSSCSSPPSSPHPFPPSSPHPFPPSSPRPSPPSSPCPSPPSSPPPSSPPPSSPPPSSPPPSSPPPSSPPPSSSSSIFPPPPSHPFTS